MPQPVIDVKDLCMSFRGSRVLDGVSFKVARGETLGLFGISGCGKTTLGRCIVGLDKPQSGQISFEGRDMLRMNRRDLQMIRPKIQMIFQNPESSLNPRIRAYESIAEPLKIHTDMSDSQIGEEVLRLSSLVGLRHEHLLRYPRHLSGGEVQRAILARIFSLQPEFIVADEPTSMLDVSIQAQVLRLMKRLQDDTGVSYLLISHDIDLLKAVCDRIIHIEGGSVRQLGP